MHSNPITVYNIVPFRHQHGLHKHTDITAYTKLVSANGKYLKSVVLFSFAQDKLPSLTVIFNYGHEEDIA